MKRTLRASGLLGALSAVTWALTVAGLRWLARSEAAGGGGAAAGATVLGNLLAVPVFSFFVVPGALAGAAISYVAPVAGGWILPQLHRRQGQAGHPQQGHIEHRVVEHRHRPRPHRVVLGEDVAELDEKRAAQLRNLHIGFIFQTFNLLPVYSVFENVEFPLLLLRQLPARAGRPGVSPASRRRFAHGVPGPWPGRARWWSGPGPGGSPRRRARRPARG